MQARDLAELVEFSEARAYASLLRAADGHPVEIGGATVLIAPAVTTSLNLNRVIGLGVRQSADESTLDEIAATYRRLGLSYGIEVCPNAAPAELRDWLRRRRLRKTVPTAMRLRAAGPASVALAGLNVHRAHNADEVWQVADICRSVFRMPEAVCSIIAAAGHDARWRHWLVRCDGETIAASLSFVSQGVAWLGWDATPAPFRGRGAQRAMIAARVQDAWEAGCEHVTAETAVDTAARPDASGQNYEKEAFRLVYERMTYAAIALPGKDPAPAAVGGKS